MRSAVAYLRVSSDKQPLSLADQRRAIEAWARANGVEILAWYVDEAESGASALDRGRFQAMIRDVEGSRGAIALVLCYDVSRFGRTGTDEAGYYRHRLHMAGTEVVYVAESALSGADTDDLILPVLQYQKREYLRSLSRDTLRGLVGLAKRGAWCGGPAPLGYARELRAPDGRPIRTLAPGERAPTEDGSAVFLVPGEPRVVATVRAAWDWYWLEDVGLDTIRDRIVAAGIPPARATAWRSASVRAILVNPVYTGRASYGSRTFAKFNRVAPDGSGAAARGRAESGSFARDLAAPSPIAVEGAHAALASDAAVAAFRRWEAARRERHVRQEPQPRRNGWFRLSSFLLTGLTRCERCGFKFIGTTRRAKGHEYAEYICSGYSGSGKAVCGRFAIPRAPFESWIVDEIEEMWGGSADLGAVRRRAEEVLEASGAGRATRADVIRRQLRALDERVIAAVRAVDPEHADALNVALARLKLERAALERELRAIEATAAAREDLEARIAAAVATVRTLRTTIANEPTERARRLLSFFVAGIDVDPPSGRLRLGLWELPESTPAVGAQGASDGRCSVVLVAGDRSPQHATRPVRHRDIYWRDGVLRTA